MEIKGIHFKSPKELKVAGVIEQNGKAHQEIWLVYRFYLIFNDIKGVYEDKYGIRSKPPQICENQDEADSVAKIFLDFPKVIKPQISEECDFTELQSKVGKDRVTKLTKNEKKEGEQEYLAFLIQNGEPSGKSTNKKEKRPKKIQPVQNGSNNLRVCRLNKNANRMEKIADVKTSYSFVELQGITIE